MTKNSNSFLRLGHICIILLAAANLGLSETPVIIRTASDSANYLVFFDRLRNYRTLELIARGLEETARAQEAYNAKVLRRSRDLFAKGAISEEDFTIDRLTLEASALSIDRYRYDAEANAAEVRANNSLLPYVQGLPVQLKTVYEAYVNAWNAQCAARQTRLKEAKAQQALSAYRLAIAAKVVPGNAISIDQYELRKKEDEQALADVRASQSLFETCHEGDPTLEFLASISRPYHDRNSSYRAKE